MVSQISDSVILQTKALQDDVEKLTYDANAAEVHLGNVFSSFLQIEEKVKHAAEELDAHVVEIIKWHFSPETGSPFWLDWASKQDWNPLEEVRNFKDIFNKFPHFQDEWLRDLPN